MAAASLDLDVLRTFVAGVELGTFSRAAATVRRSRSAVSTQLSKLESLAGAVLLEKSGRRLVLTDAGETMLAYARRLLALNDEAMTAVGAPRVESLRFGMQEDFADSVMPQVFPSLANDMRQVRAEVYVGRSADLLARVSDGRLDAALAWGGAGVGEPWRTLITHVAVDWIAGRAFRLRPFSREPLPLLVFEQPCAFRSMATDALDRAGIRWRIALTSSSLAVLWAAAEAGLGVVPRTSIGRPRALRVLNHERSGLPRLSVMPVSLCKAPSGLRPRANRLVDLLTWPLATRLLRSRHGSSEPGERRSSRSSR